MPVSIRFTLNPEKAENKELEVGVALRGGPSDDGNSAVIFLDVELHHKDHKGPYALLVTMMGEFEKSGDGPLDWKPFIEINGPAIVFPYLRELVSNITARTGTAVVFPPMNIAAMAKASKEKQEKKQ